MILLERIVKVKDGKVSVDVPRKDGEYAMISVETVPHRRTLRANRYYFGALIRALSEHTGMTVDEIHEYIKFRFNPKQITDLSTGEIITVGGTTTTLDSVAFAELTMKIQELCSQIGITNISPDQYWKSVAGE